MARKGEKREKLEAGLDALFSKPKPEGESLETPPQDDVASVAAVAAQVDALPPEQVPPEQVPQEELPPEEVGGESALEAAAPQDDEVLEGDLLEGDLPAASGELLAASEATELELPPVALPVIGDSWLENELRPEDIEEIKEEEEDFTVGSDWGEIEESPAEARDVAVEEEADVESRVRQVVVFMVSGEQYAVDIAFVEQIIEMQPITVVPRARPFIEGLINLRGTVLPVINVHRRLGLPEQPITKETRVMVVDAPGDLTAGLLVDAVIEVLSIPLADIEPPSPLVATVDSAYMVGVARVGQRLIVLMDLEPALM